MGTSSGIGKIDQICYVTEDIGQSVEQWAHEFGAGPFFLMDSVQFPDWTYEGKPQDLTLDLAVGQLGPTQIEFIRPHSRKPSVYSHAMSGGAVLHHYGVLVDNLEQASGLLGNPNAVATARSGAGTRFSYVDCRPKYGLIFELIEKGEDILSIFGMVADASPGWDGKEPLRPLVL